MILPRCVPHYGSAQDDGKSISLNIVDVVVTTYGTPASEVVDSGKSSVSKRNDPLFDLGLQRIILDEAHIIKSLVK